MLNPRRSVEDLSDEEFVAGWKAVTGEPPAAMLEDRSQMIQMILDSVPPEPDREPQERPTGCGCSHAVGGA